jgi:phage FluMu protein Com
MAKSMKQRWRCQFCGHWSAPSSWHRAGNKCPKCRREYDALLAQDSEGRG